MSEIGEVQNMVIICPKCGKTIKEENILAAQDIALCGYCEEIYAVSELGSQQPDSSEAKNKFTPEEGIEQLSKMVSYKNTVISTMDAEKNHLIKTRDEAISENQQLKEMLRKPHGGYKGAIIIGIIGIVISIIVGYQKYNNMKNQYFSEYHSRSNLKSEYDTLLNNYEKSKSIWIISISSIQIGNWSNSRWVSNPGEPLSLEKMRYLRPRITYNSNINGNESFFVKVIDPNGNLERDNNSPEGFTYRSERWIYYGLKHSVEMGIWGNNDKSEYQVAGLWTIEIWYNNVCLISENFNITP
jgi:hypothetical protein